MGKQKRKGSGKGTGVMRRSDVPYAQRLRAQQMANINAIRDKTAMVTMLSHAVALHELEGIGYKRLVRHTLVFRELIEEFYADMDVGMNHAQRRLASHGIPVPEDVPRVLMPELSPRDQQLYDHAIHASYVAHLVGLIADNETFGYGKEKLERISIRVAELTDRYNEEGEGFLLEEMQKIGFPLVDGRVVGCLDENNEPITYERYLEGQHHEL